MSRASKPIGGPDPQQFVKWRQKQTRSTIEQSTCR